MFGISWSTGIEKVSVEKVGNSKWRAHAETDFPWSAVSSTSVRLGCSPFLRTILPEGLAVVRPAIPEPVASIVEGFGAIGVPA